MAARLECMTCRQQFEGPVDFAGHVCDPSKAPPREFQFRLISVNGADRRVIALFHREDWAKAVAFALNVLGDAEGAQNEYVVDNRG